MAGDPPSVTGVSKTRRLLHPKESSAYTALVQRTLEAGGRTSGGWEV